jgi:hypothetical protein
MQVEFMDETSIQNLPFFLSSHGRNFSEGRSRRLDPTLQTLNHELILFELIYNKLSHEQKSTHIITKNN